MKKKMRGSFTVEAAVIVPLILFIVGILLHTLFYYHDKNILMAVAHETVTVGCGREVAGERELEDYFHSRIKDKLLLFARIEQDIKIEEEKVKMVCKATRQFMSLQLECAMKRTEPESYIRDIRKIKKIGEGMGD